MHTSSGVDNVDEFAETIERRGKRLLLPLRQRAAARSSARPSRSAIAPRTGSSRARSFTDLCAPITARSSARTDGRWIAFAMMNKPVEALQQSFLRTKATRPRRRSCTSRELKANSSNNTIFADDKGEIAYLHPQFVPRRDDRFDYTKPVDGSDPATDWGGAPRADRAAERRSIRPTAGSRTPTTGPIARPGAFSPKPERFPELHGHGRREFPRASTRTQLLTGSRGWTLDKLQAAAFDSYQPGFAALIPRWSRPMTRCRRAIRARPRWRSRSRCCAAGTIAGARTPVAQIAGDLLGRRAAEGARCARRTSRATRS